MCLYICIYAYISFTQFRYFNIQSKFRYFFSSAPGNSFNAYTVLLKTIISLGFYPLLRHLHSFCVPPPSLKHFFIAHGVIIFYKYK